MVAGRWIKLACERSLREHNDPPDGWIYDQRFPDRFLKFAGLCKHVEGELAGQPFALEPWQLWIICEGYGWRFAAAVMERRFADVIAQVAKKNGKTTFAAVLGLFETCLGDAGSQVYSVATKQDQAKICWEAASHMVPALPPEMGFSVLTGTLEIKARPNSKFKPLSKETKSLDGLNPQLGIVDEAAAIRDRDVIENLTTALGARVAPWMFYITTAQSVTSTLYFERRGAALAMLKGESESPRTFAAIYELDEGDDPLEDPACWIKANPNLGVSVRESFLHQQVAAAKETPSLKSGVLCKNFNVWAKSASAWIPRMKWDRCAGEIEREGACFIGTDLAQTMNLTVVSRLWVRGRKARHLDFRCFLPQGALASIPADLRVTYEAAIESKVLEITSGAITDYDHVAAYLRSSYEQFEVEAIGVDPWNATQLLTGLQNDGLPAIIVRQGINTLSAPSKALEAAILAGNVRHDGNPFVAWQFENCLAAVDEKHNLRLSRDVNHPERQVDAVTAAVVAFACLGDRSEVEGDDEEFEHIPADVSGDADGPEYRDGAVFW